MGSSASKAAKAAGKASTTHTVRKYPKTASSTQGTTNASSTRPSAAARPGPTVHPEVESSSSRSQTIDLDSADPDFQSRLRDIGPVNPNPTFSHSSTYQISPEPHDSSSPSINTYQNPSSSSQSQFRPSASAPSQSVFPSQNPKQNPAVSLLTARYRLAEEAERELENIGRSGGKGRTFLDVVTVRQILVLRDEKGVGEGEIERVLGLKRGVVGRLGGKGVVGATY